MKDNRMSIAVISCDAYQDIVKYYLEFMKKNWPDCPYDVIIATETYDHHDNVAKTIMCGENTTWTKRAIDAIQSCDSPYVLMTVDDLFISEKVDTDAFEQALDFIESHGITYYRIPWHLASNNHYKTHPDNPNVNMIPENMPYGRSIGSSIWERNELLGLLGDGTMSAWELEDFFCKEASNGTGVFYKYYVSDKRYLLHSVQMISQSKWEVDSVKMLKKMGYEIDTSARGFLPKSVYRRRRIIGRLGRICPVKFRKTAKKILRRLGIRFFTSN